MFARESPALVNLKAKIASVPMGEHTHRSRKFRGCALSMSDLTCNQHFTAEPEGWLDTGRYLRTMRMSVLGFGRCKFH